MPGLKLVIQLSQGSEIEFLNFNIRPKETMKIDEFFSDKEFNKMEKMLKSFKKSLEIDSGYCGIDKCLRKICEQNPDGRKCLISDDFVSPC